ncbi:c-type cytochrome [Paucibacter soli]|uniref:c-type cytochrome n=1 Tax=Paucibacter soli TaxID=3133433 RepID=UPI0030A39A8D
MWRIVLSLLLCASATAGTLGRQAPPRANAESVAVTSSVRSLYIVHCAGCHGMDGAGSALGNVPDMRRLGNFLRLEGGREFVVSVPGVMGSGLSDQQVAEVTNWVLGGMARASLPEGHQPYGAAEVRRARATPLLDVAGERARLKAQALGRQVEID